MTAPAGAKYTSITMASPWKQILFGFHFTLIILYLCIKSKYILKIICMINTNIAHGAMFKNLCALRW